MAITVTLTRQPMKDGSTKLKLLSPYSPSAPADCKAIGGTWNATIKAWLFDVRDSNRVRDLCLKHWGIDPLAEPDEAPELVSVRLHLDPSRLKNPDDSPAVPANWTPGVRFGQDYWLFGREILNRPGRDASVKLGQGVILISGGFDGYGGSRANPSIGEPRPDTIIEIRDVPAPLAEEAVKNARPGMPITIVRDAPSASVVPSGTAQIGALFGALAPEGRRAVIMSMIATLPSDERPSLVKELRQYLDQGAI